MASVRFNDLTIERFDTDDTGVMTVTAIARAPGPLTYRNADGTTRTEIVSPDFLRRLDADDFPLAGRMAGIPVTLEHPPYLLRQDANEIKKFGRGQVKNKGIKVYSDGRTEVQFEVMDSDAQQAIINGEKPGVSLGYMCNTVHRDGKIYQEEPYQPDHLAITAAPRAKEAMITGYRLDSADSDVAWEVREDGADMATRRAIFNGEIPGGFAGPGMSYPIYSASSAVGAWMSCQYGDMPDSDQMRSRILQIANDNDFMDQMPEDAFIWAEKNGVRLDADCGCSDCKSGKSCPCEGKKKSKKGTPTMDSSTATAGASPQLFAFDLEDGKPPIMLDSVSWEALRGYADAKKCPGGYSIPDNKNCRGSTGAKKESQKLKNLGKPGLNAANAAKLAHLRKKTGLSNSLTAANDFNAQFGGKRRGSPDKRTGSSVVPWLAARAEGNKSSGQEQKARNQAKGKAKQEAKRFGTALPEEADLVGKAMAANEKKAKNASAAAKRLATREKNKAQKAVQPESRSEKISALRKNIAGKYGPGSPYSAASFGEAGSAASVRDKGKEAITAANAKRAKDKSAAAKRKATREKNRAKKPII